MSYSTTDKLPIPFQIKAICDRVPHKIAINFENCAITYRELDKQANALSTLLAEYSISPGSRVMVYMEHSIDLFIALVAILYRGATYVPVESSTPTRLLEQRIGDAAPDLIITQKHLASKLGQNTTPTLLMDNQQLMGTSITAPRIHSFLPNEPIYLIYTSGSTGIPKGVEINHEALSNRLMWMRSYLSLTDEDKFLFKTPISFDVSIWELILPLLIGSTVVIADPHFRHDLRYISNLIEKHKITICHFVPTLYDLFLESIEKTNCASLKRVVCSGEVLKKETASNHFSKLSAKLYNFYGPTEAAIDVTAYQCQPCKTGHNDPESIPIGCPIDNVNIYLLDEKLQQVGPGDVGEIIISGPCLASCYINQPEVTAKNFPIIFINGIATRVYKTGDLGKKLTDGCIQFLGRNDDQMKIAGCRIEPHEIEHYIYLCTRVKQAVVLQKKENDHSYLVAFVVLAAEGEGISKNELINFLRLYLQDSVIPKKIIFLKRLPTSIHDKLDKVALLSMDVSDHRFSSYSPPNTAMEKTLVLIWGRLLNVSANTISREDDFFYDLGGNSLLAISLISFLEKVFQPLRGKLCYSHILKYSTLRAFSSLMEQALPDTSSAINIGV